MAKRKSKAKKTAEKISKNKYYVTFIVIMFVIIVIAAYFYRKNYGNLGTPESGTERESVGTTVVEGDSVKDLTVTFIDVGQGDAILIELPDGKNMLVDAGDKPAENKTQLDKALRDKNGNKKKLDYVVATHPDSDHIYQMPYIYENYDVGKSFRPYVKSGYSKAGELGDDFNLGVDIGNSTATYYNYLKAVKDEGTPWDFFYDGSDFGGRIVVEETTYEYTVDFMMPYAKELTDYVKDNPNNYSAVFMLRYAGRNLLFTGDIGKQSTAKTDVEKVFAKYYEGNADADCDVLKVAHHGSESSTCVEFLNVVKPEYSVISCGLKNKHKHPTKEALDRLIAANSKIYRTDLQGNVVLTVNAKGEMKFTVDTTANDEYIFCDYYKIVDLIAEGKILKN